MPQTFHTLGQSLSAMPPDALEDLLAVCEQLAQRYPGRQAKAGKRLRDKLIQLGLRPEEGLVQARFNGYPPVICEFDLEAQEVTCMCRASLRSDYCPHGYAVLLRLMTKARAELERREEAGYDWARNLALVDAFLAQPAAPSDQRVAWLVSRDAQVLEPSWQRLKKNGRGWTKPRSVPLRRLVDDPDLPRDSELERVARQVHRQHDWHFGALVLDPRKALLALAGSERVFWQHDPERRVEVTAAEFQLALQPRRDGWLQLGASFGGVPITVSPTARGDDLIALPIPDQDRILVGRSDARVIEFLNQVPPESRNFPPDAQAELFARCPALETSLPLRVPASLQAPEGRASAEPELELSAGPEGLEVRARVRPAPGAPTHAPGAGPSHVVSWDSGKRRELRRDLGAEAAALTALRARLGLPAPESSGAEPSWRLAPDDACELLGRLQEAPELARSWPAGQAVQVSPAVSSQDLAVEVVDQRDWFGLEGTIELEGWRIPLRQVLWALREGQRHVVIDATRWLRLSDELFTRLQRIADLLGRDGALDLTAAPALKSLLDDLPEAVLSARWRAVAERLEQAADVSDQPPAELQAELRPYQREGYGWLLRLATWGVGACLADDMGLGKTIQTIALLLARREEGPALVVAPTSVGGNWLRELERFAPDLRVQRWRETERSGEAVAGFGAGDVVVTSYDLARIDAERLQGRSWGTLVFDEAQRVKNAATKTARALRDLEGGWRLALTGTPIENHLGELWALFRLVSPGLLGGWESFQSRYVGPIEREQDALRQRELARRVQPFILRRTKAEVLPDLPPRTDVRVNVELSQEERKLYEAARVTALTEIKELGDQPRFELLAMLTRLRQLACHPGLVDQDWQLGSSKLDAFLELSDELREGGHRALVFSQFTSHLGLIRAELDAREASYLYLDGSTPAKRRQELVDRFQGGEGELFLISLKAGGTGLNLTGATYVIHLDPWWNPAVEDQATDRAHRIGQQEAVTVYRLVTSDTIEEQILALHETKRDLTAGVLAGTNRAGKLSTDELIELIRAGGAGAASVDAPARPRAPRSSGPRDARSQPAGNQRSGNQRSGSQRSGNQRSGNQRSGNQRAGSSGSGSSGSGSSGSGSAPQHASSPAPTRPPAALNSRSASELLQQIRSQTRWTQARLARELGVSAPSVRKWLNGANMQASSQEKIRDLAARVL